MGDETENKLLLLLLRLLLLRTKALQRSLRSTASNQPRSMDACENLWRAPTNAPSAHSRLVMLLLEGELLPELSSSDVRARLRWQLLREEVVSTVAAAAAEAAVSPQLLFAAPTATTSP